jgi:hypothetical protein
VRVLSLSTYIGQYWPSLLGTEYFVKHIPDGKMFQITLYLTSGFYLRFTRMWSIGYRTVGKKNIIHRRASYVEFLNIIKIHSAVSRTDRQNTHHIMNFVRRKLNNGNGKRRKCQGRSSGPRTVSYSPKNVVLKCKQKFHVAFTVLSLHTRDITQHSEWETIMKIWTS